MNLKGELIPIYDSRQSFYGKAIVDEKRVNVFLYSYGYKVASYNRNSGKFKIYKNVENWDSQTTIRHINEFRQQLGLSKLTKKEMISL